ncbi:OsmC family protein [Nesterenkonia halophila]|uniref:OsmC family protein n=1 Tax=Nesterenkonia halophila TaxID=302044 RepID=UPI001478338D|nr:OsmC family protein [Nesterenkonia halophila]
MSTAQKSEPGPRTSALYIARAENQGGTDGTVQVENGPVLRTASPADPHRGPDSGFDPEQFVAMAWSTCLNATLEKVLDEHGLENDSRVRVEVELHREAEAPGYRFEPTAVVAIEGLDEDRARELADEAHARCPVSKLLSGPDVSTMRVEEFSAGA